MTESPTDDVWRSNEIELEIFWSILVVVLLLHVWMIQLSFHISYKVKWKIGWSHKTRLPSTHQWPSPSPASSGHVATYSALHERNVVVNPSWWLLLHYNAVYSAHVDWNRGMSCVLSSGRRIKGTRGMFIMVQMNCQMSLSLRENEM